MSTEARRPPVPPPPGTPPRVPAQPEGTPGSPPPKTTAPAPAAKRPAPDTDSSASDIGRIGSGAGGFASDVDGIDSDVEGPASAADGFAPGVDGLVSGADGFASDVEGLASAADGFASGVDEIAPDADGPASDADGPASGTEGSGSGTEGRAPNTGGFAPGAGGTASEPPPPPASARFPDVRPPVDRDWVLRSPSPAADDTTAYASREAAVADLLAPFDRARPARGEKSAGERGAAEGEGGVSAEGAFAPEADEGDAPAKVRPHDRRTAGSRTTEGKQRTPQTPVTESPAPAGAPPVPRAPDAPPPPPASARLPDAPPAPAAAPEVPPTRPPRTAVDAVDPAPRPDGHRPFVFLARPVLDDGTTTRPHPIAAWVRPRAAAAVACAVLGLGLIGGAVTGSWLTGESDAAGDGRGTYAAAAELWHSLPVNELFPLTIKGEGAGPGGADRTWNRVAVAPDSGCAGAFDPLLRRALAPVGCARLLRATYTDATRSHLTTVGLLFTRADADAMRALRTRFTEEGLDRRTDLMPRPYAAPGTPATVFGDAQRATWTLSVLPDAPVVAYAVSGFADGRRVTEPEPAADAMKAGATSAPAQAGLGNDAKGIADRVERSLRKTATTAPEGSR
ncbi:hypothetical protein RB200_14785 [Streptomyces sp. PmtG]